MSQSVLFDVIRCENGREIGIATLNKPEALNALDLEMVNLLLLQLREWQQRDDIAMVVLDSRGDKAFCAGGDVVSMHRAMAKMHTQSGDKTHFHAADIPSLIETFFTQEYRLDYLIHRFEKPIMVWGNGIIMGGGLGLMAGASHRIVTQSSRIAMPEVSIGLYPDVGGSWFLNRMPNGCGKFLGITGASVNAADALYVGLADHLIAHEQKSEVLNQLKAIAWEAEATHNHRLLSHYCQSVSVAAQKPAQVETHQDKISELAEHASVEQYIAQLLALETDQDKWLEQAQSSVLYGSPITMKLVFEQLHRASTMTLAECFQMELTMSCRCATLGEFEEGVRALLVDKDRKPNWLFKSLDTVPDEVIATFFESPWNVHPLSELGHEH